MLSSLKKKFFREEGFLLYGKLVSIKFVTTLKRKEVCSVKNTSKAAKNAA